MSPRGRLLRKYVVVFVTLVSGALLTSGAVELYFSYQEAKSALVDVQREKASGAAARIEGFVKEIERQIGWTTQPQLVAPTAALEQRRIDFLRLQNQVPAITELSHIDGSGREQLRVSRLAMDVAGSGADYTTDPKFREARGGKTYFGPVYFRKESEPYMTIAMPQRGGGGVTVAEVNLKFIWDVVSQIKIGKAGRAFVVDGAGTLIAHPDISLVLQKTTFGSLEHVHAAVFPRAGAPDVTIARDLGGKSVLTAHATIVPLRWFVFVEQPLEEAFEPVYGAIKRTIVLAALGVVLSVLVSLVLARKMVNPIRALEAGAARIGAGDLGARIEVRTGDEIEALAEQFNRMTGQLQESYATLEHRVEERTRELTKTHQDLTRSVEKLTALGDVGQAVSSSLDLETVLNTIVARAVQLAGASAGTMWEYDEAAEEFQLRITYNADDPTLPARQDARLKKGEGAVGRLAVTQEPIQVPDITQAGAYDGRLRDILVGAGTRALLAVPLLREGTVLGGLVMSRRTPGEFPSEIVDVLKTFATQSALAIQNARLFREIEQKSRELEAASRHKSEFLASMSHELRTPLNAIIGFSDVLLDNMFGELNEKQTEYLQDILGSGKHLLSLINDILDLSKVEAGRMELDLAEFDLPQTIDDTLVLMRERAERRGITVARAVDERLGDVRADERKVKQVLLNLLSNAVKFTPEGGRIDVRAAVSDGKAEISVTDTGIGIAPEDQAAVFEEFTQVGTASKKVEGTGLGLALCRKFVELHGGQIWVKSQVGEGSTFTFTIPLGR